MKIISYDISNDFWRGKFAKMLKQHGAIRLQYSVYEVINTNRITDNLMTKIEAWSKHFSGDDSVIIFDVDQKDLIKYGNAIHRDKAIVFL
ncbi:CRISPR-associated endonuclease Cas2 [Segatella bryantii]|jgi:CRISPR-associated protein Cas2|uniref:CRISPR-associated endonuclease Cas2 n=1 Tax=Segatella bryantii TaxID=77095 RepID=UPI00242CB6C2|nr:CRISPR-associated endonuclease Cas2 [Segatella bryantii]